MAIVGGLVSGRARHPQIQPSRHCCLEGDGSNLEVMIEQCQADLTLWGSKTRCVASAAMQRVVFVDEAAEDRVANDGGWRVARGGLDGGRRSQVSASVWSLLVVVGDVLVQYSS